MLSLIFFLLLLVGLIALTKRSFELVLPPAVLAMMPLLMALGMVGQLSMITIVLGVLLLVVIALLTLRCRHQSIASLAQSTSKQLFTPGFAIFVISAVILFFATRYMHVWLIDDVAQWAFEPKLLLYGNGFANGSLYEGYYSYANYTQGVPLLYWWTMHIVGAWSEQGLYFTLYLLYVVFFLPLFANLRWSKGWLIPFGVSFCLLFPVIGNEMSYDFLGVDSLLSICFGYALILTIQLRKKTDFFTCVCFVLACLGLLMIKEMGLLLLVFIFLFYVGMGCHRVQTKRFTALSFLLPVAVYGIWLAYCQATGRIGLHNERNASVLTQLLSGTYVLPEGYTDILPALWYALTGILKPNDGILLCLPRIVWLVSFPALILLISFFNPSHGKLLRKISLWLVILFLLLFAFQYLGFFTVFYDEIGFYTGSMMSNMNWLMQRYLAPASIGFAVVVLYCFFTFVQTKKAKKIASIVLGSLFVVMLLCTNWTFLYTLCHPYQQDSWAITIADETYYIDQELLEDVDRPNILVDYNFQYMYMRYAYAPYRFTGISDVFSGDDLKAYIAQEGITHVIVFEGVPSYDGLPSLYTLLAEMYPYEPIEIGFLYTILWEGDEIWLRLT